MSNLIEKWSRLSDSKKSYTLAKIFAFPFVVFTFLMGNPGQSPTVETYIYFNLAVGFGAIAGIMVIGGYNLHVREQLKSMKKEPEAPAPVDCFGLNENQLIGISNHLDKVVNNRRTGSTILLGLGTAILLWVINPASGFIPEGGDILSISFLNGSVLLASGSLVLLTILSILFSLSDGPTLSGSFLKAGLLPDNMTLTRYKEELRLVIEGKQEILLRMRVTIGMGIFLFLMFLGLGLALIIPERMPIPAGVFPGDQLYQVQLISMIPLLLLFVVFIIAFLSSPFLNIIPIGEENEVSTTKDSTDNEKDENEDKDSLDKD